MIQQLILSKLKDKVNELAKLHGVPSHHIVIQYNDERGLIYVINHQFGSPEIFPLSFN